MTHEHTFWEGVAGATNPGWNIRITRDLSRESPGLAGNDCLVYAIDVSTWWFAAGAMSSLQCRDAIVTCRAFLAEQGDCAPRSQTAADVAGNLIVYCGAQKATAAGDVVGLAIAAAGAALHETRTYEFARASNEKAKLPPLAGHWLCLAYRAANGTDIYTRPAWLGSAHLPAERSRRFLHPEELLRFTRQVVKHDTTNQELDVYRSLKQSGGALIAPELR